MFNKSHIRGHAAGIHRQTDVSVRSQMRASERFLTRLNAQVGRTNDCPLLVALWPSSGKTALPARRRFRAGRSHNCLRICGISCSRCSRRCPGNLAGMKLRELCRDRGKVTGANFPGCGASPSRAARRDIIKKCSGPGTNSKLNGSRESGISLLSLLCVHSQLLWTPHCSRQFPRSRAF